MIIALNAGHEPRLENPDTPGNGCEKGTSTYHGETKIFFPNNSLAIEKGEFKGIINENKFNEDLVRIIASFLDNHNRKVILSRPPKEYWSAHKYKDNLDYRINLINDANADLLIDIHGNGNPDSDKNGFSIIVDNSNITSQKYKRSLELAELVFKEMERLSFNGNRINPRAIHQRSDLRVIRETRMPAILIECGYMTNDKDMALLANEEYRIRLARTIIKGLNNYINLSFL